MDVADTILNDVSNHQADLRVFTSDFNFGNCYSSGVTNAYLNRKLISSAGANQEFKVVDFA